MLFAPGKASVPRGPRDCPRIGPEGNLEGPPTDALTQTFLSKLYQNCSSFRHFFVAKSPSFPGPNLPGPNLPGPDFPGAQFAKKKNHPWAQFAWTHFLSGVDLNLDIGFSHDVFPTLSAFFS